MKFTRRLFNGALALAACSTLAAGASAMKSPEVSAKLGLGTELEPRTPADLERFLREDTDRWSKLIKAAGIRLE